MSPTRWHRITLGVRDAVARAFRAAAQAIIATSRWRRLARVYLVTNISHFALLSTGFSLLTWRRSSCTITLERGIHKDLLHQACRTPSKVKFRQACLLVIASLPSDQGRTLSRRVNSLIEEPGCCLPLRALTQKCWVLFSCIFLYLYVGCLRLTTLDSWLSGQLLLFLTRPTLR